MNNITQQAPTISQRLSPLQNHASPPMKQVTPEADFSYASFETNVRLSNYDDIVRGVLEVFRPKKFTMTLFAETKGMEAITQVTNGLTLVKVLLLSNQTPHQW